MLTDQNKQKQKVIDKMMELQSLLQQDLIPKEAKDINRECIDRFLSEVWFNKPDVREDFESSREVQTLVEVGSESMHAFAVDIGTETV